MAKLPEMHCCSGYVASYYVFFSLMITHHYNSGPISISTNAKVLVAGDFNVYVQLPSISLPTFVCTLAHLKVHVHS